MKVTIGNGRTHEVDPEVLDYVTLHYGNMALEKYDKLDMAAQTGLKFLVKQFILKNFLKAFGLDAKLPRGTDPNVYLLRAYIILMRESLKHGNLHLVTDGEGVIIDANMAYDGMEDLTPTMAGYLEDLKGYAGRGNEGRELAASADQDRTRPKLVASREEAEWEDDGGEADRFTTLPVLS